MVEDGLIDYYGPNDGQQLLDPMNRYTAVGDTPDPVTEGEPIGYDVRGNVLADKNNVYTYDILNRQTTVSNTVVTEYLYDARGRRIAKIEGGSTTHFIYDTNYRVIEERDNSQQLIASYTYGQGMDEPLTMERSGQLYYYHRDALGSITEVSDSTGNIVERYEYDVYGEVLIFNSDFTITHTTSTIDNPYLFAGRRFDSESGNYYNRARVYSPELGRFLSMDPLGFDSGDYNLYRYALNNPTNLTDPTGEFPILAFFVKAGVEALVDALMQATLNYFFDPSITTAAQAFKSIDPLQVGAAFVTGLLPGGNLLQSVAGALADVLLNYLDALENCEEYTPEQALRDFTASFTVELIGAFVGDAVVKYGAEAVAAGLRKLGFGDLAEKLLRNTDETLEELADGKPKDGPDGPGCPINSFSAETLVMTEEGLIPISEIELGDYVLAYNELTGEVGYYPVTDLISHLDPVIVLLTIAGELIETTPEHPFFTDADKWVDAGKLEVGDAIRTADWHLGLVENVTIVTQTQMMYNLTVATAHTYFVGEKQWLVHNDGKVCGFPFSNLRGKSEKYLQRNIPTGWSTKPLDRGSGWKWVDEDGQERLRFYRGTGLPPSHPDNQYARQSHGYIRWLNADGDYLDIDGNAVPRSDPDFQWKTHIPYEGP